MHGVFMLSAAKQALFGALAYALLLLPPIAATSAQLPFEPVSSAAYLRDLCSGRRPGLSQSDQIRRCSIYLSSFQDVSDEYREAGTKLQLTADIDVRLPKVWNVPLAIILSR